MYHYPPLLQDALLVAGLPFGIRRLGLCQSECPRPEPFFSLLLYFYLLWSTHVPYPRLACHYPFIPSPPKLLLLSLLISPLISTLPTNPSLLSSLSNPIAALLWMTALVRLTDRHRCFFFYFYLFMNTRAAIFFGASNAFYIDYSHCIYKILLVMFSFFFSCLTVMFLALPEYPVSIPPLIHRDYNILLLFLFFFYMFISLCVCVSDTF